MKTIRLLYPDYVSGGLETYYLGAALMAAILPENRRQPLVKVSIAPPDGKEKPIRHGLYAEAEVLAGIADAQRKIAAEQPDRIITIGGNCMVSLAPFDYLHGRYENTGIVWIDAHPDVSTPNDGYPNAHAMVLGSLMGSGAPQLAGMLKHRRFRADEILYVGLQPLHSYQENFLNGAGVSYKIQRDEFVSDGEIRNFLDRFEHILTHFDVDVLDEHLFRATYFANPELTGDGSGGGRMTLEKLTAVLHGIADHSDVVGFTIAEYLPFEAEKLHNMFTGLRLFTD